MTSIMHPGLRERIKLLAQIKDPSVRRAFDKASQNLQIGEKEVADLFRAASHDNPFVPGDSTTKIEKADLSLIREGARSLLSARSAEKSYDAKLSALKARLELGMRDDDGGLRSSQIAVDRIAIKGEASGFVDCPPNARCIGTPSSFEVELDGKKVQVHPETGESSASLATRLALELEKLGYAAKVEQGMGLAILSVSRASPAEGLSLGEYHQLGGTIEYREPVGIGAEAPPTGHYLVLDRPRSVNGALVKELFVEYWSELTAGQKAEFSGRLDEGTFGGVAQPETKYYLLSGVTNLTAGEPKYDGSVFTNAAGKVLPRLAYNRPMMYDAPARIFVLDQAADRAFIGGMGGHIPPWKNSFHGFSGSAKISTATSADRAKIEIGSDGVPVSKATQKALEHVGAETVHPASGPIPHGAPPNWYFDADANTLYRIDSSLAAPASYQLAQVIRLSTES